jgi:DNA-binding response OmpR family regulator
MEAEKTNLKTILILEDEPLLMKLLRHLLKQYTVLEATNAEEALRRFNENNRTIGLLITDVTLPKSSGIQVALLLRSELSRLPVILTSGYSAMVWSDQDSSDLARIGSDSVTILQTPFQPQDLLDAVRRLIGVPQPEQARPV